LDLLNAAQVFPGRVSDGVRDEWRRTAARMCAWLLAASHPDGEITLFNDAAIGIAPAPDQLLAYAARLGVDLPTPVLASPGKPSLTPLPDSGYVRVDLPDAMAFLDVAPIGPDYLPGHAHADTLSFELSVFGQRVIVNGGTSRYGIGPERLKERGTASHSTVTIDDQDSSEVWGGFRVARRARPFDLRLSADGDEVVVACAHDGYSRLKGRPQHRREWRFRKSGLAVTDHVQGRYGHAEARYHVHPAVRVDNASPQTLRLTLPDGRELRLSAATGTLRVEPSRYASGFGAVVDTVCIVADVRNARACVDFDWT
jgi:uncharacterized heparinase superfamily protein